MPTDKAMKVWSWHSPPGAKLKNGQHVFYQLQGLHSHSRYFVSSIKFENMITLTDILI
jgi:hypothetical protein